MKERIRHGTKCFAVKSMEAFTILVLAGIINVSPPRVYTARAMLATNLPEETDTHAAGSRKQLSQLYMSRKQLPSSIELFFFFLVPLGGCKVAMAAMDSAL